MNTERLAQQVRFLMEIDKLKSVLRRTYLADSSRAENSAEHSWHLAVAAIILHEHAGEAVDVARVLEMVVVHDIVEVDAGDTFCYDEAAALSKDAREQEAARRLFGMLPPDQEERLRALWHEFEERRTPESKFANALDRFLPLLHNFHTQGGSWREHAVTRAQVEARNAGIAEAAPALGEFTRALVEESVQRGYLPGE